VPSPKANRITRSTAVVSMSSTVTTLNGVSAGPRGRSSDTRNRAVRRTSPHSDGLAIDVIPAVMRHPLVPSVVLRRGPAQPQQQRRHHRQHQRTA